MLVVIKIQLLLQMPNGDDLYFFRMSDSTKLENKGLSKPVLINFVLPIMQLKHVFDPLLFKVMNDGVEIQFKYTQIAFLNLYQTIISSDVL